MLLALLPLALPATQSDGELTLNWQADVEATIAVPGTGYRALGGGSVVVTAIEPLDGPGIVLEAFDAAGALAWKRSLLPTAAGAFVDLALAPDADRVVLLTDGFDGVQRLLVVEAFELASGDSSWAVALPEPSPSDGYGGSLAVAAGRVGVLRSSFDLSRNESRASATVLALSDGGELLSSPELVGIDPRLTLAPEGDAFVLWERDGAMAAYDLPSGTERWTVDVPPSAPDGGLAALEFAAGGALLVRADGFAAVAFDASTGSQSWIQPAIQTRALVAYGDDRVFVCGVDDGGGLGATPLSYGMLDVATGAVLWEGNRSDDIGVLSEPWETWTHAEADEERGRVALRQSGLWVFDAQTGFELGSDTFAGAATNATLARLDDGGWVGYSGALGSTGGTYVEVFDGLATPRWSQQSLAFEPIEAEPVAIFAPEGGDQVHVWWTSVPDPPAVPPFGRYEFRNALTGAVEDLWALGVDPGSTAVAPSPDGERLAVVEDLESAIRVAVLDLATGAVVNQLSLSTPFFVSSGAVIALEWTPDSGAFAIAGEAQSELVVGVFERDGSPRWLRELSPPVGAGAQAPQLVWRVASDELLLGYGVGVGASVGLVRLDAATGDVLGDLFWGAPQPAIQGSRMVGIWADPNGSTAGAAILARESITFGQRRLDLVSFDLDAGTVLASRTVVPSNVSTDYQRSGLALAPDGGRLLLGGTFDEDGQGLRPVRVDGLTLPDLETIFTDIDPNATLLNEVATQFLDANVGVVRSAGLNFGQVSSGRVELYDMQSGTSLAVFDGADGYPLGGATARTGVVRDNELFVLGLPELAAPRPEVVRIDVAPLLAGPDALSIEGGALVLAIDGGPARAGHSFFAALGFQGTEPGTPLGSIEVPLAGVIFSAVTVPAGGAAVWADSFGVLDADGTGRATVALPPLPAALAGETLHTAAVAVDPIGLEFFATQPAAVQLTR